MRVCVCVFVPSPQAESELQRATMDAARTTRQLEETIDEFERHKIQDIKVCLGFFFVFFLSCFSTTVKSGEMQSEQR